MDDASMVGPEIATAKAKTAAGFRQPTKVLQQRLMEPEGLRYLTLPATLADGAVPTPNIDRIARDELDMADAGRTIVITLTAVSYRSSAGRGPTRAQATDAKGNYVSLVYFGGNSGWVKKLLPIGEPRRVSGKLEMYGQELQIVHPDYVLPLEEAGDTPEREAIYPLSEGMTARRMGQLAAQALERAPDLAEWIEPGLLARHAWPGWREALSIGLALISSMLAAMRSRRYPAVLCATPGGGVRRH